MMFYKLQNIVYQSLPSCKRTQNEYLFHLSFPSALSKSLKQFFFGITALDRHYEHPTSVQITHYVSAAHKKLQIIVVDPTKVHVVFDIPSVFWTVTFEVLQFLRNRHL